MPPTGLTYTDAGVIGDPATNHYYLVGAFHSADETLCDNRVGEFDFAITVGPPGDAALNDIALPLDASAAVTDAESLANWIEVEGGVPFGAVRQLLQWDAPFWLLMRDALYCQRMFQPARPSWTFPASRVELR